MDGHHPLNSDSPLVIIALRLTIQAINSQWKWLCLKHPQFLAVCYLIALCRVAPHLQGLIIGLGLLRECCAVVPCGSHRFLALMRLLLCLPTVMDPDQGGFPFHAFICFVHIISYPQSNHLTFCHQWWLIGNQNPCIVASDRHLSPKMHQHDLEFCGTFVTKIPDRSWVYNSRFYSHANWDLTWISR